MSISPNFMPKENISSNDSEKNWLRAAVDDMRGIEGDHFVPKLNVEHFTVPEDAEREYFALTLLKNTDIRPSIGLVIGNDGILQFNWYVANDSLLDFKESEETFFKVLPDKLIAFRRSTPNRDILTKSTIATIIRDNDSITVNFGNEEDLEIYRQWRYCEHRQEDVNALNLTMQSPETIGSYSMTTQFYDEEKFDPRAKRFLRFPIDNKIEFINPQLFNWMITDMEGTEGLRSYQAGREVYKETKNILNKY